MATKRMKRMRRMVCSACCVSCLLTATGCFFEGTKEITPVNGVIYDSARAGSAPLFNLVVAGAPQVALGSCLALDWQSTTLSSVFFRRAAAVKDPRQSISPEDKWSRFNREETDYALIRQISSRCPSSVDPSAEEYYLEELIKPFLISALIKEPGVGVIERPAAGPLPHGSTPANVFVVNVKVTSIVEDVRAASQEQSRLLEQAGFVIQSSLPYVSLGASMVLAPLGGMLMAADVITGLPIGWSNDDRTGALTLDTRVVEASSGRIIASFPSLSLFRWERGQIGKDWSSGIILGSGSIHSKREAKEEAVQSAAKDIAGKIRAALGARL